jgi:hypothetical protein
MSPAAETSAPPETVLGAVLGYPFDPASWDDVRAEFDAVWALDEAAVLLNDRPISEPDNPAGEVARLQAARLYEAAHGRLAHFPCRTLSEVHDKLRTLLKNDGDPALAAERCLEDLKVLLEFERLARVAVRGGGRL